LQYEVYSSPGLRDVFRSIVNSKIPYNSLTLTLILCLEGRGELVVALILCLEGRGELVVALILCLEGRGELVVALIFCHQGKSVILSPSLLVILRERSDRRISLCSIVGSGLVPDLWWG
jgi:hypothetical protein